MQHGRAAMLNSWRCAATAHRVLLELGHHCLLAGCACSVQRPGGCPDLGVIIVLPHACSWGCWGCPGG